MAILPPKFKPVQCFNQSLNPRPFLKEKIGMPFVCNMTPC